MPSPFIFLAIGCLLSILFYRICKPASRRPPLPPGPPSYPLIGHLLSIPADQPETIFHEWGKTYGDVIHLHAMGKSFIILSSVEAAYELLEKRSHNYSGRPRFPVFELMGWEPSLTLLPYGKKFHLHRRMMHEHLNQYQCVKHESFQARQARMLVQNILSNPERRDEFTGRYGTAIAIWVAYGHEITSDDDWHFQIAKKATEALFETGPPGGTPIDVLPFLHRFPSWFPGTYYATFARKNKFKVRMLHEAPILKVQQEMIEGNANPSFAASQLESISREGAKGDITISDIQGAAAIMHAGGTDTTWVTLSMFFLAMVLHPECQVRAQEEIDSVIGLGRLPELKDRQSLPYLECILQETLRWHQAVPLGLPHCALKDDIYKSMLIPKDSLVIANMRAMTLDSRVYSDPFTFNPSRYLPRPVGMGEPHPNVVFGWGRRICPGRHLASASVWIAIATVLATVTISKATDDDGKEITPEVRFTSSLVNQLLPYRCNFEPRHKSALSLLVEST